MICGLDIGTCFSSIGYLHNGSFELIHNSHGNRITPSCIAVSRNEVLVGEDALYVRDDPDFTFIEKSKTLIGSNTIYSTLRGDLTPQDVTFLIAQHLCNYATSATGHKPIKGVVTVPAYFNAHQRKLTREAAEKTGIEIMRIISEPTAASLVAPSLPDGSKILVYDLGGGTFDCSILEVYKGLARVISTHGDTNLGGKDFDEKIARFLVPQYSRLSEFERKKLLVISECAKKALTTRDTTIVNLKEVSKILVSSTLNRREFAQISLELITKTKECIFACLKDAELEPSDLHKVYLVGGSTRMQVVTELLNSIFPIKPQILGNPDESVAIGATIHACDISGDKEDKLLIDIVPLSLGVEIENGVTKRMIKRNSPIPCDYEELFTTAYDNQEKVEINILQGEAELAKNNAFLGTLTLDNLEKALRGEPKILVKFTLDSDAMLQVEARDIHTNSQQSIKIQYTPQEDFTQSIDDPQELLLASLKTKINSAIYKQGLTTANMSLIEEALASTNIEFVQSVIEDIFG